MRKIILFLLILTSCSSSLDKHLVEYNGVQIEQEFIPHVQTFEKACNKKVEVNIRFGRYIFLPGYLINMNAIGVCIGMYMPSFFLRYIYIDRDWWDKWGRLGEMGEELILHELGHCVLDRGHTEDMQNYVERHQIPKSIMYPSIFGYWGWYSQNREKYLEELCQEK